MTQELISIRAEYAINHGLVLSVVPICVLFEKLKAILIDGYSDLFLFSLEYELFWRWQEIF